MNDAHSKPFAAIWRVNASHHKAMLSVMSRSICTTLVVFAVLAVSVCSNQPTKSKITKNQCRYEITAENFDEVRPNCVGLIKAEHAEEVMRLRDHDALVTAQSLAVPFEDIALAAIMNDKSERYCLTIFGEPPSKSLEQSIETEDELLDCAKTNVARVSISRIEAAPEGGYRVYIIFDCGLSGRCQSAWWVYVEEVMPGTLRETSRELDWIT